MSEDDKDKNKDKAEGKQEEEKEEGNEEGKEEKPTVVVKVEPEVPSLCSVVRGAS